MSIDEHAPAKRGRPKGSATKTAAVDDALQRVRHTLDLPIRAFTIGQFCQRWGFSRPHFYKLRKLGQAPAVIGSGKGQRVSVEEESRWLKRQERLARKAG